MKKCGLGHMMVAVCPAGSGERFKTLLFLFAISQIPCTLDRHFTLQHLTNRLIIRDHMLG